MLAGPSSGTSVLSRDRLAQMKTSAMHSVTMHRESHDSVRRQTLHRSTSIPRTHAPPISAVVRYILALSCPLLSCTALIRSELLSTITRSEEEQACTRNRDLLPCPAAGWSTASRIPAWLCRKVSRDPRTAIPFPTLSA